MFEFISAAGAALVLGLLHLLVQKIKSSLFRENNSQDDFECDDFSKTKDPLSDDIIILWYKCPKCGADVENPHRWTGGKGEVRCWRCGYCFTEPLKDGGSQIKHMWRCECGNMISDEICPHCHKNYGSVSADNAVECEK